MGQIFVLSGIQRRLRVLICDNDEVYRIGLCALLKSFPQIVVVGETAEPAHALELSEVLAPHLAVVSSEFGGAALLLIEALNREGVRILMVGTQSTCEIGRLEHPDDAYGYLAREAGAVNVVDCVQAAMPA
ncbi:hypothetical protein ACPW96_23140 [Micromonospora sp. DT81.3]|uniref:hypothetical protein n=1 Tax=Micromonospora sp. DT81.3 TaxID=3416523 RepID=UPI003CE8831C